MAFQLMGTLSAVLEREHCTLKYFASSYTAIIQLFQVNGKHSSSLDMLINLGGFFNALREGN